MIRKTNFLWIVLAALVWACNPQPQTPAEATTSPTEKPAFEYSVWLSADHKKAPEEYQPLFKKFKDNGIDAVLINTGTDPELLSKLTPLATAEGLKVHAWIMAMNRPGDTVALKHPDWYAVSREGKSCFDTRPYVDYYQWLCPTREASRNHLLGLVEGLAKVDGIASVHLDYIRYCDIFLPIGLLPKYDLVQNNELPEFDFCYCDVCVETFEKLHHKNPREMEHPELDIEWRQFRLNQIKAVVDDSYAIVHKYDKNLTAAVFPYPEMAARMVRQRWDKWNIDEVFPMVYHNFYNEELDWIGFVTKQGVSDLKDRGTQLNTGLFVPALSPEELKEAIELARANGAKGVSFFDAPALSDEHLAVIKASKQ